MGLPIISTNVGGIPYLLEDRKDALLVPSDDPMAMSNAIKELLQNPALAERLAINAREKVMQFSWTKVKPLWIEVLSNVSKDM